MDQQLQHDLMETYILPLEQPFKMKQVNTEIDLSIACGQNASAIPAAKSQPNHHPDHSFFRFDKSFKGLESSEVIISQLKQVIPVATFVKARGPDLKYH